MPRNVVFIVLDSLRKDRVSVYNSDVGFTENLDELAEEATVFEDAVANAPWTLPSHASMFTGMYPWEHGATQRNLSLDVEKMTLAERFSAEGYRTACISTNAWLSGKFGLGEGFDRVDNLSSTGFSEVLTKARRAMDEWLSSPGNEWLKRALVRIGNRIFHYWLGGSQTETIIEKSKEFVEDDGEFFLFLNLMDAHEPYFPPPEYLDRHDCVEPRKICQDPTDFYAGREEANFEEIGKMYDASVDYMDDQLGELFQILKDRGEWEDTIVVIVSDHGQLLGENGGYGHQYSVAEELVQVPMMVKSGEAGEVESQVELREIYPLLLSEAGIGEEYVSGTELAKGGYDFPDIQRPRIPPDKWQEFYQRHRFVRTHGAKLVESETEDGEKEERFERGGDLPGEKKQELRAELKPIEYEARGGEGLDEKEKEIQQKLRDLGYG